MSIYKPTTREQVIQAGNILGKIKAQTSTIIIPIRGALDWTAYLKEYSDSIPYDEEGRIGPDAIESPWKEIRFERTKFLVNGEVVTGWHCDLQPDLFFENDGTMHEKRCGC